MNQACRDVLTHAPRGLSAHAGLLLSRYLRVPVKEKNDHPAERRELYRAVIKASKNPTLIDLYRRAYQRRYGADLAKIPSFVNALLKVRGRLIVGLGGENVLETGIMLHHTYGVPVIPGSALKGLASHYCHQVWGWGAQGAKFRDKVIQENNIEPQGEYHRVLFGSHEDAGYIVFHDAWIDPDSLSQQALAHDVMTPHHGDYYEGKDDHAPTDFDDPNPITFLSVTGTFHIALSCNAKGKMGLPWAELALELLTTALQNWGVGGKTNAGYGRMVRPSITTKANPEEIPQDVTTPSAASIATAGPRFKAGDQVTAQRVEDPKGKGRIWFQAEDGFGGRIIRGAEPQIDMGANVNLWIAAVNSSYLAGGYNFSSEAIVSQRQTQMKKRHKG